eukprot:TRINITY_DN54447_c0_g1_i1.p1 TRINITY_DN54447_c0_g1~~TRINITY_DN54447_c0_g1_i1.p1  ORF type:complete len:381 (-),score=82.34 TRINITY_DN54447_c0_g1_i1:32-1114(-)
MKRLRCRLRVLVSSLPALAALSATVVRGPQPGRDSSPALPRNLRDARFAYEVRADGHLGVLPGASPAAGNGSWVQRPLSGVRGAVVSSVPAASSGGGALALFASGMQLETLSALKAGNGFVTCLIIVLVIPVVLACCLSRFLPTGDDKVDFGDDPATAQASQFMIASATSPLGSSHQITESLAKVLRFSGRLTQNAQVETAVLRDDRTGSDFATMRMQEDGKSMPPGMLLELPPGRKVRYLDTSAIHEESGTPRAKAIPVFVIGASTNEPVATICRAEDGSAVAVAGPEQHVVAKALPPDHLGHLLVLGPNGMMDATVDCVQRDGRFEVQRMLIRDSADDAMVLSVLFGGFKLGLGAAVT